MLQLIHIPLHYFDLQKLKLVDKWQALSVGNARFYLTNIYVYLNGCVYGALSSRKSNTDMEEWRTHAIGPPSLGTHITTIPMLPPNTSATRTESLLISKMLPPYLTVFSLHRKHT
jgi:hypothetical protein